MLDLLTSFFQLFRTPSQLLLASPTTAIIQPMSTDDIADLWDMLAPQHAEQMAQAYLPLTERAARKRLDNIAYQLQQRGGTVRGAFLCTDLDSEACHYPALPVGLLKLYTELPQTARWTKYAPVQRFHKDEKGWLWLALLLAEPNPQKTTLVTTVPVPTMAKTPVADVQVLARLMDVPAQAVYPAPVQVAVTDLPSLHADSDVATKPLPMEADDTQEDDAAADEDADVVAAVPELPVAAVQIKVQMPVRKPVEPTSDDDDDKLADWLTLDEHKAPRIALSQVIQADNIAFIGPKGSGKTTLLLTAVKHRQGQVIALDPHATPHKWPCQTIGNGRKYEAIRGAFKALQTKMQERFDDLGNGTKTERHYQQPQRRRTMVNDEFRSIAKSVLPIKAVRDKGVEIEPAEMGAGDYLLERISEGRKVGECVMIAGHNDTNESLALPSGAADMKTCFDYFVYCGGMALERYERRGKAKIEALNELRAMRHPAVVWHTERNQWYLLDFDLTPVLPPDDEEHDEDEGPLELDTAVLARPRVLVAPSPTAALRLLAQRAAITVPVTGSVKERLALLDDPRVVTMLHIVGRRGMNAQEAAHVLFEPVNGDLRTAIKKIFDTAPHA